MPAPARHIPQAPPTAEAGSSTPPTAQHQFGAALKRFWYIVAIGAIAGLVGGWGLAQVATPGAPVVVPLAARLPVLGWFIV